MDAAGKLLHLIGGDVVGFHPLFVGVAMRACGRDVRGIDFRFDICHVEDVVAAMAAGTLGDLFVPLCIALPVDTGAVFIQLIHSEGWIVRTHV